MISYLARSRKNYQMKKLGIVIIMNMLLSLTVEASSDFMMKVDTFDTTPASITMCEDIAGEGIGTFDLTSVESDIVVILPNMLVAWFSDAGLTLPITNPAAYMASSSVVFAQVISTLDPTCQTTEEVTLTVLSKPDLSYLDAVGDTICGRHPFRLGSPMGPEAIYNWLPADYLDDDSVSNPIFTPDDDIDMYLYGVIATSLDGMCQSTGSVSFLVLDAELDIDAPDTLELCKGSTFVMLSATSSEHPENITWMASRDTLSDLTGPTTSFDADYSTTVIASLEFENGCILYDTVLVRVDSLPKFDISVIPDPRQPCNKYCPGDIVTLVTQAPDLACYPDIEHLWTPSADIAGTDTTLNIAIATSNGPGQLYTRETTNHACMEIDTHFVDVVDTIIDINGLPLRICRGDQFTLTIDNSDWPDLTEVMWSSSSDHVTLSCDDCQTTTVSVSASAPPSEAVNISVMGIKEMCCSASGSVNFIVIVPGIPIQPLTVCVGGSGQIMADDSYTDYNWQPQGSANIDPDDVFNPTVQNVGANGSSFLVSAIAPDGCPSEDNFTVGVFPDDVLELASPDTFAVTQGTTVSVVATTDPIVQGDLINWADGNGNQAQTGSTATFIVTEGNNNFCATIINSFGCEQTECINFTGLEAIVFIPNAFAPNGTVVINRTFQPLDNKISHNPLPAQMISDFQIYNRWGQKVYDNDSNATGWDGRQDGKTAPSDVYIYIIKIITPDGDISTFTGDVSLIR